MIKNDEQKMKIHNVKILEKCADDILTKKKTFVIRHVDGDYQVGDIILFYVADTNNKIKEHTINNSVWQITYILDNFGGLRNGYVAMSIKELTGFEILMLAHKLYAGTELKNAYFHLKETKNK